MSNLDESLHREYIRTNRMGAYCCSSIVDCNTRKYHGALVVPIPELSRNNHVLLSSLDLTILQHGVPFNLGLHHYQGETFSPKGHKYIREYNVDVASETTYRVGGVVLRREIFLCHYEHRIIFKYTLLEAHSETTLRFSPLLAFRDVKMLTHRNDHIDRRYESAHGGYSFCLYPGYPRLYLQLSQEAQFVDHSYWNEHILYFKERERGYEHTEDLYVPGYFECVIEKGKPLYFSAGITEANPDKLEEMFEAERAVRIPRSDFRSCLLSSAQQFYYRPNDKDGYLLAGYPWFGVRARDLFIALPGCTIYADAPERYYRIMDTVLPDIATYMYGGSPRGLMSSLEDPDVFLWAIWSIQQYVQLYGIEDTKSRYGDFVHQIIEYYISGYHPMAPMDPADDSGLLYAIHSGTPVSWMDAKLDGRSVIGREGFLVELNALWYNALCFLQELLPEHWTESLDTLRGRVKTSFCATFINEHGYLYDYVTLSGTRDLSVRPNMLLAVSLPYSPLSKGMQRSVLDFVTRELKTPKGLRSLSPKSEGYRARCEGPQRERELSYYNGSVWSWLLGAYIEAYLKLYGNSGLSFAERALVGIEEEMHEHGIGTISELFDGNPPYRARGAISLAMSVGEIIRAQALIKRVQVQHSNTNSVIRYNI